MVRRMTISLWAMTLSIGFLASSAALAGDKNKNWKKDSDKKQTEVRNTQGKENIRVQREEIKTLPAKQGTFTRPAANVAVNRQDRVFQEETRRPGFVEQKKGAETIRQERGVYGHDGRGRFDGYDHARVGPGYRDGYREYDGRGAFQGDFRSYREPGFAPYGGAGGSSYSEEFYYRREGSNYYQDPYVPAVTCPPVVYPPVVYPAPVVCPPPVIVPVCEPPRRHDGFSFGLQLFIGD